MSGGVTLVNMAPALKTLVSVGKSNSCVLSDEMSVSSPAEDRRLLELFIVYKQACICRAELGLQKSRQNLSWGGGWAQLVR